MSEPLGVLKLVGISGFVKGETFTVRIGESVSIGRSRSCSISVRDVKAYRKVDPLGQQVNEHFKTISREHVVLQIKGANEILVHDGSSNGTYIDGKRIGKTALIKNLPTTAHELKLGTNEAFRMEWRKLVRRRKVQILELADGDVPPEGAVEIDLEEARRLGYKVAEQEDAVRKQPAAKGATKKKSAPATTTTGTAASKRPALARSASKGTRRMRR